MHKTERGFSAIELFIVIAVVLCLVLLLAPLISNVTSNALRTSCMGNLRRLHQAFETYRQNYKGAFPSSKQGNEEAIRMLEGTVQDLAAIVRCPASKVMGSYSYDPEHVENQDDTIVLGDSGGVDEFSNNIGTSMNHDGLGGFYLRVNGTIDFIKGSVYRREIKVRKIRLLDCLFRQDSPLKGEDTYLTPLNL